MAGTQDILACPRDTDGGDPLSINCFETRLQAFFPSLSIDGTILTLDKTPLRFMDLLLELSLSVSPNNSHFGS